LIVEVIKLLMLPQTDQKVRAQKCCGKRRLPRRGAILAISVQRRRGGRRDDILPSRTSRWYACQFHRTCRSSGLYYIVSSMSEGCVGDGCGLTSGGGLARIDVADNDHVDVHLFLTARRRQVSKEAIEMGSKIEKMEMMLNRWTKLNFV